MENEFENINTENTIPSPTLQDENENIIDTNSNIETNNDETPSETIPNNNEINENNTSNCLALTIKEDYKLTSKTNKLLRSLRMSFKVFVSYVTLNIIKLFF